MDALFISHGPANGMVMLDSDMKETQPIPLQILQCPHANGYITPRDRLSSSPSGHNFSCTHQSFRLEEGKQYWFFDYRCYDATFLVHYVTVKEGSIDSKLIGRDHQKDKPNPKRDLKHLGLYLERNYPARDIMNKIKESPKSIQELIAIFNIDVNESVIVLSKITKTITLGENNKFHLTKLN